MNVDKWYDKYHHILEVAKSGIQYSCISIENQQCFPFVHDSEFVVDATAATIYSKPIKIYGFEYSPFINPPVCLDNCRILLRDLYDKKFIEHIHATKNFLNLLEMKMKCDSYSKIQVVKNTPIWRSEVVLLTSPAKWMLSPPMLSLYTLMISIGLNYNDEDTVWGHCQKIRDKKIFINNSYNQTSLKMAWKTIMDIIESGGSCYFKPEMKENWPNYEKTTDLHNKSGIVPLATGIAKPLCPNWYTNYETLTDKN